MTEKKENEEVKSLPSSYGTPESVLYNETMKKLVIISGISGAGKTTAANILEDMGYLCIDQYPVELLDELIDLIRSDNTAKYQHVALTIPIVDLERYDNLFRNSELKPVLILIDASIQTIINRYKFTRRVHPLLISNKANSLIEAVEIEKGILEKFRLENAYVIDTTALSLKGHKEKLDAILGYDDFNNLSISFISFGYKYGVPDDADLVFDVRILDNPFYVSRLKKKTGNERAVQNYVLKNEKGEEFMKRLISYIDFTLEAYDIEEKRHISIYIGCTGGMHRSVTVANALYKHYKKKYLCYVQHRELDEKV